MADLAVLAIGFGVMPLAAILLYAVSSDVLHHREAAWGILAGVTLFLGLSHAMALVLTYHSLLGDRALATLLSTLGLAVGTGIGWLLLEGPYIRTEPHRVLAAAVLFVGLHSFGDGLTLGGSFVGGGTLSVPLDAVTVSATVVHRFVEGTIVVVPALAASWKPRLAFLLLFSSLLAVPAAYVATWLVNLYGFTPTRSMIDLSITIFASAVEATLALFLVARAFLPKASLEHGTKWMLWVAVGFVGISVVHFLVE
ncbi:MAG TPA: hypothetical protein VF992_00550 [Thermoplasmata archaeon]